MRVLVNYQTQGELYLGTVAQWDGGSRVSVRYDDDRRTRPLSDAEISSMRLAPAGGPLPRNFPKELYKHYAAAQADEKRIVDAKMLARRQKVALRPAGHASHALFSSPSGEHSSSARKTNSKRLANKHVGKTIMRAVLHPSTQALLDTVKAKVIEFIPRNRESGTPSLWRIRHENGKEEIIDYSKLTQCLELKERSDTEMKMAEFVKENEWRLEDLQTSLCENFEGLTPSAASKMLKGWAVGIGSATTARMTYNFMSPEGKRFRSRLEVIRHFAGQNKGRKSILPKV